MTINHRIIFFLTLLALPLMAVEQSKFELKEGDRVVFVGNTFFERDIQYGYLETLLTLQWPDRNITFRNLGWSGDDVWGHSRGSKFDPLEGAKAPTWFGEPKEGYKKLLKHIEDAKPTVIFLAYGMSESFEGEAGLPAFEKQYNRFLSSLVDKGIRIVLVSPIPHEKLVSSPVDPSDHNKNLARYTEVIRQIAADGHATFIDLFTLLQNSDKPLTDNGIHLNDRGYLRAAVTVMKSLGLNPKESTLDAFARLEPLRKLIQEKNQFFFNQWRPANDTYIFGFRRHEQGRNEVDIPQFNPIIAEKEAEIAKWSKLEKFPPVTPVASQAPLSIPQSPDPDPELERATFKVADGFEVNLFAAEPMVVKPVAMNFDARGRLWVASASMYPQIKPGERPSDRILILEDTDGDGRADKSTVFADGLLIPTGIEVGNGGAYVANSTELVQLRDTDGDGHADARRTILSGFGTEDTHHILHALRWGNDGGLYFNQSIYIHSNIETPQGTRRLAGGGVWRFRPPTSELEIYVRGMCNPWGHSFDYWGQSFGSDGCGDEGIHYMLPGATHGFFPGGGRYLPGLNPGQPKYCGLETISGRHFPDDWQGNVITNDFRANRVVRFQIAEKGAGYTSKLMPNFIKATDVNFRPVDLKMGPDGALYLADWYNPIINHGEVDFRDPRRDHVHGRIWRITAKGRPLVTRPKLVDAPVKDLLDHLKDPEEWTRHFANRTLAERDSKEVQSALRAWLKSLDPKDPNIEHHRLEALWVYETLDVVEPNLLTQLLHSPEPHVRAAATRTLSHWMNRLPATAGQPKPTGLLETLVTDEFPRVRVEAIRALVGIPQPHSVEVAMRALDKPMDSFLDYALWLTANELQPSWMPSLERGELTFSGNDRHLQFALQSVGSSKAAKTMLAQLKSGKIPSARQENVFNFVASFGTPQNVDELFEYAMEKPDAKIFAALNHAARQQKVHSTADLLRLKPMLAQYDDAIRLAGAWKAEVLRPELATLAETKQNPAAIEAIAELGGAESIALLLRLHANGVAVAALASLDPKSAAPYAAEMIAAGKSGELIQAFLQHQGGAEALAAALDTKHLAPDPAKMALRAMYSAGRSGDALEKVLKQAAGLAAERKPLTHDELMQLVAEIQKKGNVARGEAIFRRDDVGCLKCHTIAGKGGKLAPDLSTIGSSSPLDYITESVIDPNKATKDGFSTTIVITQDEDLFSGIPVRRTKKELVLRDATHDEIMIPIADIKEERGGRSLMPDGLADLLTHQEFLDLVRFLSELGKTK